MDINKNLFSSRIKEFSVETLDLGEVQYVNLDNAATTPPFKEVEKTVASYLTAYGSVHRGAGYKSKKSTDDYEQSRVVIKDFVGAQNDCYVLFTGNTTGAMNSAAYFFSFLKGKVAVSSIEHSSSWLPWIKAEGVKAVGNKQVSLGEMDEVACQIQKFGREQVLTYAVNDQFEFDLADIEKLLKENQIKAFILTASSNATGYCPPIKEIGEIVHRYGAWYVVDACQFLQHHSINMVEMGIDFLAASGHKFYAPYGGGFLIGPKRFFDMYISYEIGGGNLPYITKDGEFLRYHNQLAHDPGTPNAVGAIAMAAAFKVLKRIGLENIVAYEQYLARRAYEYLAANPKIELFVQKNQLNTILSFNVKGREPREVARELNDRFGIGVRAGSFCVYNVIRHLLKIKDESEIIQRVNQGDSNAVPGFIRASVSLCNTDEDINRFIKALEIITAES
jgi:cysteine desulfurase